MLTNRTTTRASTSTLWTNLVVLFKVRVVSLLLFAAVGGAFLGAGGPPETVPLLVLLLTGALTAMGASAINEYVERDRDGLMNRTRRRPLVTGAIGHPKRVLLVSLLMIILPVVAVFPANPALAVFLALGALIYVGVYTLWLKPRTSLNIVIGGAAGSCAVLAGGAAVGAWSDPGVLALSLLVFFWTPIHFWALALVYKEDYARADVPMLPVQTSPARAAFWALIHGAGAGLTGFVMAAHPALGPVYLLIALPAGVALIWQGVGLLREPIKRRAWTLFHTSNLFLAAVLLAVCLAALLQVAWPSF